MLYFILNYNFIFFLIWGSYFISFKIIIQWLDSIDLVANCKITLLNPLRELNHHFFKNKYFRCVSISLLRSFKNWKK